MTLESGLTNDAKRRLLSVTLAGLFAVHASRFAGAVIDDSYISFRYARHLANGDGLVWNLGEKVEGYTNFLWVLVAAFFEWAGISPVLAMPLLGLLCGALLVLAVFAAGKRFAEREAPDAEVPWYTGAFGAALLAASATLAFYASSGLETSFYALILGLAGVALAEARERAFVVLTAVAFLIRPEAGLLGVVGTLWLTYEAERAARSAVFARIVVFFVLLVGPYLVWKLWYFGSLLPMTIRAKAPVPMQGLQYVGENLLPIAGLVLLAGVLLWRRVFSRRRMVLLGLWALYTFATIWVGPDWMPAGRLMIPFFSFLALSLDGALVSMVRRGVTVPAWRPWVRAFAVVACLAFVAVSLWRTTDLMGRYRGQLDEDKRLAALIHALEQGGSKSIATVNIGLVGYTAMGARIIDLVGLCDAHIGMLPGPHLAKEPDAAYLASRNVDIFILTSSHPITKDAKGGGMYVPDFHVENHIFRMPWFQRNYAYQGTLVMSAKDFYHVFAKQEAVTGRVR